MCLIVFRWLTVITVAKIFRKVTILISIKKYSVLVFRYLDIL